MNETNAKTFWDTNLWIYLFVNSSNSEDQRKKAILLEILEDSPIIYSSVQVLNEVGNVLLRKYKYPESDVKKAFHLIDDLTEITTLTKDLPDNALDIKATYQLSWFDSIIIAAALKTECTFLFTEDLHPNLIINNKLTVINPFL